MSNIWTYEVTWYDRTDLFVTSRDISSDIIGIPMFTDTGSGVFNSAVIVLSLSTGKYITESPIIEDLDRIRITGTDYSGNTYNCVYDVMKRTTIKDESGGTKLEITLLGIEHWLDKFNFSQPGFFKSAKHMSNLMIDQYNASRGTHNPVISNNSQSNNIQFPDWTINTYDYGIGPEKIYQRLVDLADKLGGSVENGGVLDYFDIRPLYNTSNVTSLFIEAFSSGNPDVTGSSEVTITDTLNVAISNARGSLDSIQGNVINVFGGDAAGSLPLDFVKFRDAEERFDFVPEWIEDINYPVDSFVQRNGIRYFSNSSTHGVQPPAGVWTSVSRASDYGNVFQYSPWTVGKARSIWQNSGGDPVGKSSGYGSSCQFDSNITIWGEDVFRCGVDTVATSPEGIANYLKYGRSSSGYYTGLRALVNGTGTGDWAGSDSNNVSFRNSVVEYDNDRKEWLVKYSAEDGMYIAVFDVAKVYRFSANSWIDVTFNTGFFGSGRGDCFHPTDDGVKNTAGINNDFSLNNNSAVFAQYTWNPATVNTTFRNRPVYYKQGAWLSLRFPFPISSVNGISESVGDIFGGGTKGVDGPREPSTLDIQNNEWTPLGDRGWNNGSQTENLGQISSINFFMKIKDSVVDQSNNTENIPLSANYKIRCTVTDLNDNTAIHDFVLDFNDEWQAIELPVSGFSVIRNRRPKEIADLVIPPKQLNVINSFEWRHIKSISWQTQESYDEEGRYDPQTGRYGLTNILTVIGGFVGISRRVSLFIDSFRFTKPLIANTGKVSTDIAWEADTEERPDINNYFQLLGDALSILEKKTHRFVEYTIQTSAKFDIRFGDFFFYTDKELVPFNEGNPNTVKLVAKHIEYSMTEDGLIRTIVGIKRFT